MPDHNPVRKPKRSPYVVLITIIAVFQIVLGTLSVCGPAMFFGGVQEMLLTWNDNLQASIPQPKGQPRISQREIQDTIHERLSWLRNFERVANVSSLVLCAMMIAGGIGMLYLRRWAWQVSVLWAVLSLIYTVAATTVGVAYIAPMQMEVTTEVMNKAFDEMPAPPPGQPDIRPMMKSMMQSMGPVASIGPIFVALILVAYATTVLVLLLLPSLGRAFQPGPVLEYSEEPEPLS